MRTLAITGEVLEAIALSRFARSFPAARLPDPRETFRRLPHAAKRQWIDEAREDLEAAADAVRRPVIVCLCGSTRFWRDFQEAGLRQTLAGKIVLSIGAARAPDDEDRSFGGLVPVEDFDAVKEDLDRLHLRKIDLADEVFIINRGGYIGASTRVELEYARATGKLVHFLELEHQPAAAGRDT